eukprot:2454085-Rhodomonas_salina.1
MSSKEEGVHAASNRKKNVERRTDREATRLDYSEFKNQVRLACIPKMRSLHLGLEHPTQCCWRTTCSRHSGTWHARVQLTRFGGCQLRNAQNANYKGNSREGNAKSKRIEGRRHAFGIIFTVVKMLKKKNAAQRFYCVLPIAMFAA